MLEKLENFSRAKLITGDVVKNSKGSYGIVLKNTTFGNLIVWFKGNKNPNLNAYRYLERQRTNYNYVNDDLSFADGTGRITKVYRINDPHDILSLMRCSDNEREVWLLWEEKPAKEMTVKEIEKELGHKVKIVDESKNDDDCGWLEEF